MRGDPLAYLSMELDTLRRQGLYRRLRILEKRQQPRTRFDGREVVNLSSNNYLGLTTHPKLIERALEATREFGVGTGSVRTIAGTMALHMGAIAALLAGACVAPVVVQVVVFASNLYAGGTSVALALPFLLGLGMAIPCSTQTDRASCRSCDMARRCRSPDCSCTSRNTRR